jgi:hypothetical protein
MRGISLFPPARPSIAAARSRVRDLSAKHTRTRTHADEGLSDLAHTHTYTRAHARAHARTRTHTHAHARTCTHTHAHARTRTHARTRPHGRPTNEQCDVRSAGVADWKTTLGGNTERTLTAAAGPSPRDPYRHALTMRPPQKVRPFSFLKPLAQ